MSESTQHDPDRCSTEGCRATLAADGTCHVCASPEARTNLRLAWELFVASRPASVQATIAKYGIAPNRFYTLIGGGDGYYQVTAVGEDGSVEVLRYNVLTGSPMWSVFGVNPADLILWRELPWVESTETETETAH